MTAAALPRTQPRDRQAVVGLSLAALVIGGWLALHALTLFVWRPEGAQWLWAVPLVAVQSWLSVGLFITAHDAMHGSLAPGRPGLEPGDRARGADALRRLLLRPADERALGAPQGTGQCRRSRFLRRPSDLVRAMVLGLPNALFRLAVLPVRLSGVGIAAAGGCVPLANLLALYALPAILSSVQLFAFGTFLPHRHDGAEFPDRHNSRTNDWGTLVSLASCYHFGYHHEHHLSPNVPWWRLPARRREALAAEAGR